MILNTRKRKKKKKEKKTLEVAYQCQHAPKDILFLLFHYPSRLGARFTSVEGTRYSY